MVNPFNNTCNVLTLIGSIVVSYGLITFFIKLTKAIFRKETVEIPHILDINLTEWFEVIEIKYVSHDGPTYDYIVGKPNAPRRTDDEKRFKLRFSGGKLACITVIENTDFDNGKETRIS